ncbi:DEAD/DEAH box helicase [Serratia fonticola]|jgi:hypothetical protein|uniref:DEAD/DEAH box helicase n=1 Tax=Serratia fonticola TaxID=47917 RepID=UPI003AAC4C1A
MAGKMNKTISPEDVSAVMNFDATDPSWQYRSGDMSMAAKQAEGVAGLWNILSRTRVGLLADEVGMGKTYQAIGLMLMLWRQKPNARILIMAPNKTLCHNWEIEFTTFVDKHYRTGQAPDFSKERKHLYKPSFHGRIEDLTHDITASPGRLYLTTIHALSGLVEDKSSRDKRKSAAKLGAGYRKQITESMKGGFDLVIVDEAHYFRNRNGDSQRAAAAAAFFGGQDTPLAKKTLLLTATPNHSSTRNVYDILSYFTDKHERFSPDDVRSLMETYAIRRLRKMRGKGGSYSKHHYRRERAIPATFEGRQDAELFFALYQKKLVQQLQEQHKSGNRAYMYGYLEGFESTGGYDKESISDDGERDAFYQAPDTLLLGALTRQFNDVYHRFPDHPKYDALIDACSPARLFDPDKMLHVFKHVVFVRRIPSVREITQRVNASYDEIFAARIVSAWGLSDESLAAWRKSGWSRSEFARLLHGRVKRAEADDFIPDDTFIEDHDPDNELKLSSKIAELFVVKKTGQKRTDCTNVSLRFRRPENLFSLFLEPALDGKSEGYFFHYRGLVGGRERDTYADAARDARLMGPLPGSPEHILYDVPLTTAWAMMFKYLPTSCRNKLEGWLSRADGAAILENFATYLRTGYLFASPVMTELYCWYTEFSQKQQDSDVQRRYRLFTRWVERRLEDSLMLRYFIAAIETFETLCEKIAGQPLANAEYSWRELSSLNSPAWYASGETSNRERLIVGFNSPFYPNVLVATSVFQEGVNLHLQCHQIHHYGIAWTPGDNEQRNGRVDRLFGQVNSLLQKQDNAEMTITYPYLEGTFDQDQLASFIRRKHRVEEKLDSCEIEDFTSEINEKEDTTGWEKWLRQPSMESVREDPYPALRDYSRRRKNND